MKNVIIGLSAMILCIALPICFHFYHGYRLECKMEAIQEVLVENEWISDCGNVLTFLDDGKVSINKPNQDTIIGTYEIYTEIDQVDVMEGYDKRYACFDFNGTDLLTTETGFPYRAG